MRVLLILLFCVTFLLSLAKCEESVIVKTNNGQIKGKTIQFNNHVVTQFSGIPFAEPPVGDLRFAKPKPAKSWNDIYDATKIRNSCWQRYAFKGSEELHPKLNMSEDCLFLNVWTPSRDLGKNHTLLPVMYWIHGGGFVEGSSFYPLYDGIVISTHDVVVVSVNYRLGEFGFLYGGTDEAPGNLGFWDQILGLKWVKDNIKAFGGNPEDVTIFGESAGSISVTSLILSPPAKGLFKKAIAQSGSPYWLYSINRTQSDMLQSNLEIAKKLSKHFGCPENDQWLQCLKKVDAKKINHHNVTEIQLLFQPIWGDKLMPKTAQEAIKTGDYNHGVELMAGVTQDEGTMFVRVFVPELSTNKTITKDHVKAMLKMMIFDNFPNIDSERVFKGYFDNIDEHNQMGIRNTFGKVYGDYLLACPTHFYAEAMASQSIENKVHFYRFTYKSETVKSPFCNESWMGICHGEDLGYTFGMPLQFEKDSPKIDINFSKNMIQLWTNFAKSGNPLKPVKFNYPLLWPSFRDNENGNVIPKSFEINPYNFGDIKTHALKENCDDLWKPYFTG